MKDTKEFIQQNKNVFETINMKCLLRGYNICAQDWGEVDCIYGYHKFYYFQDGEATLIICGDVYNPKPGELFMIPANTVHTYFHNPQKPVLKYWCHFDLTFIGNQKIVYSPETVKCIPDKERTVSLFEHLMSLDSSQKLLDILSEKSILIELFKIFLENVPFQKLIPYNEDHFVAKMNDYILSHLQSTIKLKDMADVVPLHPNYFIPFFKRYFSVSPLEYVHVVRLEKASHLLLSDMDLTIEQVAYQVGFNDYRYFGRSFKKRYGLTPSSYRGLENLTSNKKEVTD